MRQRTLSSNPAYPERIPPVCKVLEAEEENLARRRRLQAAAAAAGLKKKSHQSKAGFLALQPLHTGRNTRVRIER